MNIWNFENCTKNIYLVRAAERDVQAFLLEIRHFSKIYGFPFEKVKTFFFQIKQFKRRNNDYFSNP